MKKLLTVVVVVAMFAIPINDIGQYLTARYKLDISSNVVMRAAIEAARRNRSSTKGGGIAAVRAAEQEGIELYGYAQTPAGEVTLWTQTPVPSTIVLARYSALQAGKPLDSPYYTKQKLTRIIQ